jgi:hypothetical protein
LSVSTCSHDGDHGPDGEDAESYYYGQGSSDIMYDLQHKSIMHRVKSYTYLFCVAGIVIGSIVLIVMAAMGKLNNQDR